MTGLDQLDPKTLGRRLSDARKARGVTQERPDRTCGIAATVRVAGYTHVADGGFRHCTSGRPRADYTI